MRNLLILGGNSGNNIKWIKAMQKKYSEDYNTRTIFFDNWHDNTDLDFSKELVKLKNMVKEIDDYYIVAKSAGAILSLIAISENIISPNKIAIMGVPLKYAKQKNINLEDIITCVGAKKEILVIQQKNDPQGKSEEIRKILPSNIKVIEIMGNQHTYTKIEMIKSFIDDFFDQKY